MFFFFNGLANSLFTSASWPCIKLIVFKNLTTTAYGFAYSAVNVMSFLGGALIGVIIDRTMNVSGGYYWSSVFLFVFSILTVLIGFTILMWDYQDRKTLYHGTVDADAF